MSSNDKDGGLHYHYDREERLARRPDRWQPSGGIFKRNRSLTIILIDVLIVLMLFGIFRLFVFGGDRPPQLRGYTVGMDAVETSQGVLAIVTLQAGDEPEESSGIVTVRFRPAGGEPVEVKDLVPEPGARRRISELFPGGTASVTAIVEIDGEALELERSVDTEADAPDAENG